jgi:hypothetical protein
MWILNTLIREFDTLYTYEPVPLDRVYLSKYLGRAISNDRAVWKKYYFATGLQHEDMLDVAFQLWQPWWVSKEGKAKSIQMKKLRSKVKPRGSSSGNLSSSLGGTTRTNQSDSPSQGSPFTEV